MTLYYLPLLILISIRIITLVVRLIDMLITTLTNLWFITVYSIKKKFFPPFLKNDLLLLLTILINVIFSITGIINIFLLIRKGLRLQQHLIASWYFKTLNQCYTALKVYKSFTYFVHYWRSRWYSLNGFKT